MIMVFMIMVSLVQSIAILRDILKRVAHLILTAHSITKISCEFLLCRNLPGAIYRHPSSSCFYFHLCIAKKELCMSFSLPTKACRLPIVQSTTTSITMCASYCCLHAVTYSLAVVLIRKLTAIFRVVVIHTVTLWVVTHSIIRTVSFCISSGALCMTPVWLVCLLSRAA